MKDKKYVLIFLMILSFVLAFIFSPFGEGFDPKTFWTYWMSMSGILGIIFISWQTLLGIRPFGKLFSNNFFFINGLHKRLGMGTVFSMILHPVAAVISREQSWTYAFLPDFSTSSDFWITMGRLSFDLFLAILFTSVIVRKLFSYRAWYYIHLLAYPAFVLAWLHGYNSGDFVYSGSMKYFYTFIGIVLVLAILVRVAYQFGFLKNKATIISNKKISEDINELVLDTKNFNSKFTSDAGQFVYLGVDPKTTSHPFSVLDYKDGKLKIAYKNLGKFTKFLALKKPGEKIFVDGSYGNFLSDAKNGDVFIAGGIGITPFYSYIKNKSSDVTLIYLNQSAQKAVYVHELKSKLTEFYNIFSRSSGESEKYVFNGTRLDQKILEKILDGNIDRKFFICGSPAVVQEITHLLKNIGVKPEKIEFEPFSM